MPCLPSRSHHHVCRWYGYHSQVAGLCLFYPWAHVFFKEFLWEFSGQFSKHPDVKILWEMTVMQDITMTLGPWCFSSRKVYVESQMSTW